MEPVLFAFGEQATTDEGGQALKRLDKEWSTKAFAAMLTKDQDGKTALKETEDVDTKHGALFGAIVGYVIGGLLAGAPEVIVGAAAGGVIGGVAAHEIDMGLLGRIVGRGTGSSSAWQFRHACARRAKVC